MLYLFTFQIFVMESSGDSSDTEEYSLGGTPERVPIPKEEGTPEPSQPVRIPAVQETRTSTPGMCEFLNTA